MRDHLTEGSKLEIGDKDPIKVNPTPPVGDELVPDPGANLPDTPDISDELVNNQLTYPLLDYKVKSDLLVNQFTNIIKNGIILDKDIVNYLFTCIQHPKESQILAWIDQNPVWVMPSLYRGRKWTKTLAYRVVNTLIRLGRVKITLYTISKPAPNMKGRNPHVYKLSDIDLNGINDPLIKEARLTYYKTSFDRYDTPPIKSTGGLLDSISKQIVDYYVGRGQFGKSIPDQREVIDYIREYFPQVPPKSRLTLCHLVRDTLWQEGG